jgi:hypothetical protein
VDAQRFLDELASTICGFPVYTTTFGKVKTIDLPRDR